MKMINVIFICLILIIEGKKVMEKKEGWVEEDGKKYYYKDGKQQKGWLKIGDDEVVSYYYLNPEPLTGFQTLKYNGITGLYYFDENGRMKTGWQVIDGKRYHFRIDGRANKGWTLVKLNGIQSYFYFDPKEAYAYTGLNKLKWSLGENFFLFDEEGRMRKGWKKIGEDEYYFTTPGGWAPKGFYAIEKDGKLSWFYCDPETGKILKGMHTLKWSLGTDVFYFDEEGRMQTGWQTVDGKKLYFKTIDGTALDGWRIRKLNGKISEFYYDPKTGEPVTGLQKLPYSLGQGWFYFDEEGRMQKGWKTIDGKVYHFNDVNGAANSGWHTFKKDGKRSEFHFDPDTGYADTGLHKLKWSQGTAWFYFDGEGRELKGWQEIDGKEYYFREHTGAAPKGWQKCKKNGVKSEFYFDKETGLPLKGLHYLKWSQGNAWFYFDEEGREQKGWHVIDGHDYYFREHTGAAPKGWKTVKKDGKKSEFYFIKSLGYTLKGLQKLKYSLGESWFYLGDDGRLQKGWKTIDGNDYYFDKLYGAAPKGWELVKRNGKTSEFYFDKDNGNVVKGLNFLDWSLGKDWFYMDENGRRQSGWKTIDGHNYYFKDVTGNSPEGWYKVAKDGKSSYFYFSPEEGYALTGRHYLKWSQGGNYFFFDKEGRTVYGDQEVEIEGVKHLCHYGDTYGDEQYCNVIEQSQQTTA